MIEAQRRILVIDDEQNILNLIKKRFEVEGYQVITESSIEKGIECLKTKPLSVLFLDLNIQGESGFEVLKIAKSIQPSLPVVMVTGCHNNDEASQAIMLGAFDYVTKPIDFDYLQRILETLLNDSKGEV